MIVPTNSAFLIPLHACLPSSFGHCTKKRSTNGSRSFPDKLSVVTRAQDSMKIVRSGDVVVELSLDVWLVLSNSSAESAIQNLKSFAPRITHTAVAGPLVSIKSGYGDAPSRLLCCWSACLPRKTWRQAQKQWIVENGAVRYDWWTRRARGTVIIS